MAFILCLFITALNFKVSKLTTVDTRISESLLTGVTGRSKCMAIHKWRMCTSRTSDNTKVPDFSFFDLRQIKTWKTEQLGWHWRYWSSFPSASEVRHMYKMMYFSEIFSGAGLGAVFYALINYIYIEWRQRLGWNHAIFWRETTDHYWKLFSCAATSCYVMLC